MAVSAAKRMDTYVKGLISADPTRVELVYSAELVDALKRGVNGQGELIALATDSRRKLLMFAYEANLSAGDAKLSEADMAREFGVSPGTVAEGKRMYQAIRVHKITPDTDGYSALAKNWRDAKVAPLLSKKADEVSADEILSVATDVHAEKLAKAKRPRVARPADEPKVTVAAPATGGPTTTPVKSGAVGQVNGARHDAPTPYSWADAFRAELERVPQDSTSVADLRSIAHAMLELADRIESAESE